MDKVIIAHQNANQQVIFVLDEHSDLYVHIPMLGIARDLLKTKTTAVTELMTKVGKIPAKPATNKNVAKLELVDIVLKMSCGLLPFAHISGNTELQMLLITSKSHLAKRMKSHELLDYGRNILPYVKEYQTELAGYGLTEEMTAELEREIAEFEVASLEPRQLISERKSALAQIEDLIDEASEILDKQIDPLMELMKAEKEFYLEFLSARMIVDPATRHRKENNEEADTDSEPTTEGEG